MQGWGEVGHVGYGGLCRNGVSHKVVDGMSHTGVRWVMQGAVGHAGVGWGGSCMGVKGPITLKPPYNFSELYQSGIAIAE